MATPSNESQVMGGSPPSSALSVSMRRMNQGEACSICPLPPPSAVQVPQLTAEDRCMLMRVIETLGCVPLREVQIPPAPAFFPGSALISLKEGVVVWFNPYLQDALVGVGVGEHFRSCEVTGSYMYKRGRCEKQRV